MIHKKYVPLYLNEQELNNSITQYKKLIGREQFQPLSNLITTLKDLCLYNSTKSSDVVISSSSQPKSISTESLKYFQPQLK